MLHIYNGIHHITAVHLCISHCSVELNKQRVYVEAIAGQVVVSCAGNCELNSDVEHGEGAAHYGMDPLNEGH